MLNEMQSKMACLSSDTKRELKYLVAVMHDKMDVLKFVHGNRPIVCGQHRLRITAACHVEAKNDVLVLSDLYV